MAKATEQGEFIEIIKMYVYSCPFCKTNTRICEDVWQKTCKRLCNQCGKWFLTDPDYDQDVNRKVDHESRQCKSTA